MVKCEGCEEEKEVTDVEGHLLCKECERYIVRCESCNRFLAVNYDELEIDNYGTLSVPELALPDRQTHLLFCNIDCLDVYLKKYRQELKDRGQLPPPEGCQL